MPAKRGQLRTRDYSQEARDRLGKAVVVARLAAGHTWRPSFARVADVSIRSLSALELGEAGVGQATLFAVARALPHWTEDTPQAILEGATAAPTAEPAPVPDPEPEPADPDLAVVIEVYEHWISKLPEDTRDDKLDEFIRYVLSARKRARSRSSDRRDDDRPKTNTIG